MADHRSPSRGWERYLSQDELAILDEAGYGKRMGFGSSPVLLVVDATYEFCGRAAVPIVESVRAGRRSCGERAWAAIEPIQGLLAAARGSGIPVVYSKMRDPSSPAFEPGLWGAKNHRAVEDPGAQGSAANNEIVSEIGPLDGELVLAKGKPSLFHGTDLLAYLVSNGVDSVIVCGGTTSGCVYATAVDAFSHNYKVSVVADATFDRVDACHWICLLDIDLKYGDVVRSDEAARHLEALPASPQPTPA